MASTFHPQVFRGQAGSTIAATESIIASTPRSNSVTTSSSSSSSSSSSHCDSNSPHSSRTSNIFPSNALVQGLNYTSSILPLHPCSTPTLPIRLITAEQYAQLVTAHSAIKCEERLLFPWMHGADVVGTQQAANFGYNGQNGCPTPRFRGLTTIAAHPIRHELPASSLSTPSLSSSSSSSPSSSSASSSRIHSRSNTSSQTLSSSFSSDSFGSGSNSTSQTSISSRRSSSEDKDILPSGTTVSRSSSTASTASLASRSGCSNISANDTTTATSAVGSNDGELSGCNSSLLNDDDNEEDREEQQRKSLRHGDYLLDLDVSPSPSSTTAAHSLSEDEAAQNASLFTSSHHPHSLLSYSPTSTIESTTFPSTAIPNGGISFRHFRIQACKYATLSDIVVYSDQGGYAVETIEIAKRAKVAQIRLEMDRRRKGEVTVGYEVLVLTDPFSVCESKYPFLVGIDSAGYYRNSPNFAQKELNEMRKFTACTPIGENVYLGNSYDVPLPPDERAAMSPSFDLSLQERKDEQSNPLGFSICIEARDGGNVATVQELRERESWLNGVQSNQIQERKQKQLQQRKNTRHFSFGRGINSIVDDSTWYTSSSSCSSSTDSSDASIASSPSEDEMSDDHDDGKEDFIPTPHGEDALLASALGLLVAAKAIRGDDEDHSEYEEFCDASDKENESTRSSICTTMSMRSLPRNKKTASYHLKDARTPLSPATLAKLAPNLGHRGTGNNCLVGDSIAFEDNKKQSQASPAAHHQRRQMQQMDQHQRQQRLRAEEDHRRSKAEMLQARRSARLARRVQRKQEKLSAKQTDREAQRAHAVSSMMIEDSPENKDTFLQSRLDEIVHLEMISSSQNLPNPATQMYLLVDAVVEHVMWIRTQARPELRTSTEMRKGNAQVSIGSNYRSSLFGNLRDSSSRPQPPQAVLGTESESLLPRRVLIHCTDGYTDSSVLALSYIMYDRACSLPEAYLHLQKERHKSFFVYPTDLSLLGAIEKRINSIVSTQGRNMHNDDVSPEQIAEFERVESEKGSEHAAAASLASTSPTGLSLNKSCSPTRSGMAAYLPRPSLFARTSSSTSTTTVRPATPTTPCKNGSLPFAFSRPQSPTAAPSPTPSSNPSGLCPWFYDDRFDGSFPSRVLDFLYLGNLSHASNALMLKELGITHVLSIGESALIPPNKQNAPASSSSPLGHLAAARARASTPTNSLWLEQSLGNITVLDIQDIQDDGVDSILPHIVSAIEYIEKARASGGKVLVHCRVGVSRSATLVIAYVMHHLDISLVDAYLLVRARRLNILIQPTILFMWTLHMYEEEIRGSAVDVNGKVLKDGADGAGRLTWPVLATEIADLNQKYLGC